MGSTFEALGCVTHCHREAPADRCSDGQAQHAAGRLHGYLIGCTGWPGRAAQRRRRPEWLRTAASRRCSPTVGCSLHQSFCHPTSHAVWFSDPGNQPAHTAKWQLHAACLVRRLQSLELTVLPNAAMPHLQSQVASPAHSTHAPKPTKRHGTARRRPPWANAHKEGGQRAKAGRLPAQVGVTRAWFQHEEARQQRHGGLNAKQVNALGVASWAGSHTLNVESRAREECGRSRQRAHGSKRWVKAGSQCMGQIWA